MARQLHAIFIMSFQLRVVMALFIAMIVAGCWVAPPAYAQAISGDLVGAVVDPSGAAIPEVVVVAMNTATNVRFTGVTNATGEYRIGNLPPGPYQVSVTATGFAPA